MPLSPCAADALGMAAASASAATYMAKKVARRSLAASDMRLESLTPVSHDAVARIPSLADDQQRPITTTGTPRPHSGRDPAKTITSGENVMETRLIEALRAVTIAASLAVGTMCLGSVPAPAATECSDFHGNKCKIQLSTGITMAYVEMGPESGPPVILLHGFTDSLHTWSYSGAPLRKAHPEWRILAVDLRGHGASSMPPASVCAAAPEQCFRVTDYAADIVAFMRARGIQRASLVGHSLGSLIAQEVALSNPATVERAVLISTSTKVADNPVIHDFLVRDTIEGTWKPAIEGKGKRFPQDLYDLPIREINSGMEEWLTTTWGADPVENPAGVAAYVHNTLDMRAGTWIGGARALQLFDNTKRLADLKVPTLVIWGIQDSIFLNDPDEAAMKNVLAIAARSSHTTNYWKQYGAVPLPSSGAQESDIGHVVEEDAPDMLAADIGAYLATGAPTMDWVHSDSEPNIQTLVVEPGKAPVLRFAPES
jgi:pimeloyl-ACP methyl ester carboxylesterase